MFYVSLQITFPACQKEFLNVGTAIFIADFRTFVSSFVILLAISYEMMHPISSALKSACHKSSNLEGPCSFPPWDVRESSVVLAGESSQPGE